MSDRTLVTGVRLVPLDAVVGPAPEPVDIRVEDGVITEVGPRLTRRGEEVVDGAGGWVVPGLWDAHVHMSQWAATGRRLDLADTADPGEVVATVGAHLTATAADPDEQGTVLEGFGWRLGAWPRLPSTAELDAVCGDRPVVLISGDCHGGWLSSAAYRALHLDVRPGHVDEDEWFAIWGRLGELPQSPRAVRASMARALEQAAAQGVVGIVDMEYGVSGWRDWPARVADGLDQLRVRPAVYPDHLDEVLAAGLRTGDRLDDRGLVSMGPLKVISDGSLNTRTAWCCDPFVTDDVLPEPRGKCNWPPHELAPVMARAHAGGLEAAIHAIGDQALADALDAFERTGARGSVEHAQLVRLADLPRMADLGITASVQPAHLLDDRDTTELIWPDRLERCFALASMRAAGVELRLGSDAPVAPLDPWEAMAAAVHRSGDERAPWSPEQALTPRAALAASVDGRRVVVGAPADLVLLEEDPTCEVDASDPVTTSAAAARLRGATPFATLVGGRLSHTR